MGSRRVNYTAAQRRAEHYANRLSTLGLTLTGEPTHPLPPDSTQSATDGAQVTRYLSRIWIVDSGCWIWMGSLGRDGYAIFKDGPRTKHPRYANGQRAMYRAYRGPIPDGLILDHYRMNPGGRNAPCAKCCVNPWHLEPVTLRENTLRGKSTGAIRARMTACDKCGGPFYRHARKRYCRPCRAAYYRAYRANRRTA